MRIVSGSASHQSGFKVDASRPDRDNRMAEEKAFSTVLLNATSQSLRDALGGDVLQILESRGLLRCADDPSEFDRQLQSFFGSGAKVLERLVVKELYRELGIAHDSVSFNYGESLDIAKEFCFVEARLN